MKACCIATGGATARAARLLYENKRTEGVDWRERLEAFVSETERLFGLLEGVMPEASWLDDTQTLTVPGARGLVLHFTRIELDGTAALSWGRTTLNTFFSAQSAGQSFRERLRCQLRHG